MLFVLKVVCIFAICAGSKAAQLNEVFEWKTLDFNWPNPEVKQNATSHGDYIPENNIISGLARWKDKLFITNPRWKAGVPATLNYVSLKDRSKSPLLSPYPDWETNLLPKEGETPEDHLISIFRINVDVCDRLWAVDTGLADILGSPKQVLKPTIVVYDLNTDKLLRRYELKETDSKPTSFFANIVVDVQPNDCENAFAYIPDLGAYGLVVYSWNLSDSWRINHNFFHFDPLQGDLTVGGINFQWTDGIFGLALSRVHYNGCRTLYFHALASTKEFAVSTAVLRNKTIATDPRSYFLYKCLGDKGERSQSTTSDLDLQTEVLFLAEIGKDAVTCWNTNRPLVKQNVGIVAQDSYKLVFPNDLKIDRDRILWVLSNKMSIFLYKGLNPDELNFRILNIEVDDAIANSVCKP